MKHPEYKGYYFNNHAHWLAGAIENLQMTNDGELAVSAGFNVEPVTNTNHEDHTPALAFDPCNRLYWVRLQSRELMRLNDSGPQAVGQFPKAEANIKKMIVGTKRIWLLTTTSINSYALKGLYPLRQLRHSCCPVLDIAGDGCDGLWWLEAHDGDKAILFHADRFGCCIASMPLKKINLKQAVMDVSCSAGKIVILDTATPTSEKPRDPCQRKAVNWRLIIVDCDDGNAIIYDDIGVIDSEFRPKLLTIDNSQQIHLIDPHTAQLWTLSLDGVLIARRHPRLPQNTLPVTGISAGRHIAAATATGIVQLQPADTLAPDGEERIATFITPVMISPEGTPSGWQRADIEAVLPEGTTLEVVYAATRETSLVNEINRILLDNAHSQAFKLKRLNERLSWQMMDRVIYTERDADDDTVTDTARRLRFPLQQVDQTHLWLRLTLYTPPGRRPPALKALSVYYPNLSYLRYLPAVYQEDPNAAAALQRFLAVFEALFGDLDAVIDRLPSQIDPETAPPSWLPFLLRWLGLPSPAGLSVTVQRNLLKQAPELLAWRGTAAALKQLLDIIKGDYGDINIRVDDCATAPVPWVLQPPGRQSVAPRLGHDTLIISQRPPAFRLGAARLGPANGTALGVGRIDPEKAFMYRAGELQLWIEAAGELRQRLESILRIFLPYFVPAHCHYRLIFVSPSQRPWRHRLDDNLRLNDSTGSRLGSETVAGQFRLAPIPNDEIMLDRCAYLDRGLPLN